MTREPNYRGVALEDLRISRIRWTEARAEHIRTRSARYGPSEFDVEPEWATEAALDASRLVELPAKGNSIQVIGFSRSAGALLKVWLYPEEMTSGRWLGASACKANRRDIRRYEETP